MKLPRVSIWRLILLRQARGTSLDGLSLPATPAQSNKIISLPGSTRAARIACMPLQRLRKIENSDFYLLEVLSPQVVQSCDELVASRATFWMTMTITYIKYDSQVMTKLLQTPILTTTRWTQFMPDYQYLLEQQSPATTSARKSPVSNNSYMTPK